MRTSWTACAVGCAALLGAVFPVAAPAGDDPPAPAPAAFADKPAEWWVAQLGGPDADVASLVLRRMGAGARPALLAGLGSPSPRVRLALLPIVEDVRIADESFVPALVRAARDPEQGVRLRAMAVLAAYGKKARAAAPALTELAESGDEDVRRGALQALHATGLAGERVLEVVLASLDDPRSEQKQWALDMLARVGPADAPAVPAILKRLPGAAPAVRLALVQALGRIGPVTDDVVPALARALADDASRVRSTAVGALQACAASSPAALRVLLEAAGRVDHPERRAVLSVLSQSRKALASVVPELDRLLVDADAAVVRELFDPIVSLGPDSAPLLPRLLEASVRTGRSSDEVARSFARLAPASVPALVAAASGASAQARAIAWQALAQVPAAHWAAKSKGLVEAATRTFLAEGVTFRERRDALTVGLLAAGDPTVDEPLRKAVADWISAASTTAADRLAALEQMAQVARQGERGSTAVGFLAARVFGTRTLNASERLQALRVLDGVAGPGPDFVSALTALLDDPDDSVAEEAARRLSMLPTGRSLLLESLGGGSPAVRLRAVRALAVLPTAKEDRPALARHLRDDDAAVRLAAAGAILRGTGAHELLRPDIEDLVPVLVEAIEGPDARMRAWGAKNLLFLGPAAQPAVQPILRRFVSLDPRAEEYEFFFSAMVMVDKGALATVADGFRTKLSDEDPLVRAAAARVLSRVGGDVPRILEVVRPLLKHPDEAVRRQAVGSLFGCGPAACGFVPDLVERIALRDGETQTIAMVLAEFGPGCDAAFQALVVLWHDKQHPYRHVAAQALARFGVRAMPVLSEGLLEPDPLPTVVVTALADLDLPEARAVLESATRHADPLVARMARMALEAKR